MKTRSENTDWQTPQSLERSLRVANLLFMMQIQGQSNQVQHCSIYEKKKRKRETNTLSANTNEKEVQATPTKTRIRVSLFASLHADEDKPRSHTASLYFQGFLYFKGEASD